jgi:asparagine synthase (glutamine-hydrolysing)
MCGIAGFVGLGDAAVIAAMTSCLFHRGPDGDGFHIDSKETVYLGHRRLAILDIAGGRQPMWNENGNVCIVFNGEIYNHQELRKELLAKGHIFTSHHSDTEVLVHGYEEWDDALPMRLNGMFAFGIYDIARRRLFLARDRFGEKPLYYFFREGTFGFASELSALLCHPALDRSVNMRSLQKLLAYGYLPAPNTIYTHASKLPAGYSLTYDITSKTISYAQYWQFSIESDDSLDERHEPALVEELQYLLGQAVSRRLISDVPIGVLLSGGIDSSAVLGMVVQTLPSELTKTFTVGFVEPSFDESAYAHDVAEWFGTEHHETRLRLENAKNLIDEVLGRLDEPLGDPSILPTYLLCSFAREEVTVALSGDGGDELFAGYDPFRALGAAKLYHKLVPTALHRIFGAFAERLPISQGNMSFDFKLRRALMGLHYGPQLWNPAWMAPLDLADLSEVMREPVGAEDVYEEAISCWESSQASSLVDRSLEFFTKFYLQNAILTKVDRASMMVSLESRAPFLDNDLVDFCRRLPNRFKYRNGRTKYLLKKSLQGLLPEQTLLRKKKGFGIPLANWMKSIPLPVQTAGFSGIDRAAIAKLWRDHQQGRRDHRLFMWTWLSFCKSGEKTRRSRASKLGADLELNLEVD